MNQLFVLSAFLVLLALGNTAFTTTTKTLYLVAPRNSDGTVVFQAMKQGCVDVLERGLLSSSGVVSLDVTALWTDSAPPLSLLSLAQAQASNTTTALSVLFSADAALGAAFGVEGIPVVTINRNDELTNVPMRLSFGPLDNSLFSRGSFQLFRKFGWNSVSVVYVPSYEAYAREFAALAAAEPINIVFSTAVDASFPQTIIDSTLSRINRLFSRVVVVIGPIDLVISMVKTDSNANFELVAYDPVGNLSQTNYVDLRSFSRVGSAWQTRGFFLVSPKVNSTVMPSLPVDWKTNSFACSAYDTVISYALALRAIADRAGNISDGTQVRNQMLEGGQAAISSYSFDQFNGSRAGDIEVLNYVLNFTSIELTLERRQVGSVNASGLNLLSTTSIFAGGTSQLPSATTNPSINVGMICPNTRDNHRAWRLICYQAAADINAAGILPGNTTVNILYSDNFDSASSTIVSAIDLVRQDVVGIVGPVRSIQSIALQYYVGGINVSAISMGSTSDSLSSKQNYPTFFRTVVRDSLQTKAVVSLVKSVGWKSFCIVKYSDDYASGVAASMVGEATSAGIKVRSQGTYSAASELESAILPIKADGCKVVVAIVDTVNFGALMRLAKQNGIFGSANPDYVWIFAEISANYFFKSAIEAERLTVADFQGSLLTQPLPGSGPKFQRYIDNVGTMLRDYNLALPVYGTFTYDAVWAFATAAAQMLRAGADPIQNRGSFLNYLRNVEFEGVSGTIKFDENQDRVGAEYGIYNFRAELGVGVQVATWSTSTGIISLSPIIYADGTQTVPSDLAAPTNSSAAVAAGIAVPIILITVALSIFAIIWSKRRAKNKLGTAYVDMSSVADDVKAAVFGIKSSEIIVSEKIGEGSFGTVWSGSMKDIPVAIKKLSYATLGTQVADFFREAAITLSIPSHPNVVKVFGMCQEPSNFSIVMEFCSGGCLKDKIALFSSDEVQVKLALGIAKGMEHISSCGVVHRDLAARNILLDENMRPKISDFGFSRKIDDSGVGNTKTDIGPVRWMSPEAIEKQEYSEKSDIWAFGMLLYEVVCNRDPFWEFSVLDSAVAIRRGQTPVIPYGTCDLIAKVMMLCWQKTPDARPTFTEVVELLSSNRKWAKSSPKQDPKFP